jgi:hypothetical protein
MNPYPPHPLPPTMMPSAPRCPPPCPLYLEGSQSCPTPSSSCLVRAPSPRPLQELRADRWAGAASAVGALGGVRQYAPAGCGRIWGEGRIRMEGPGRMREDGRLGPDAGGGPVRAGTGGKADKRCAGTAPAPPHPPSCLAGYSRFPRPDLCGRWCVVAACGTHPSQRTGPRTPHGGSAAAAALRFRRAAAPRRFGCEAASIRLRSRVDSAAKPPSIRNGDGGRRGAARLRCAAAARRRGGAAILVRTPPDRRSAGSASDSSAARHSCAQARRLCISPVAGRQPRSIHQSPGCRLAGLAR